MCFSFRIRSHVKDGESYENGQLLADHLTGVRDIALATTRMHGVIGEIEEIIELICMCHDFGKASSYFQRHLKDEYHGDLRRHGEISAYFTYYMLPEKWRLIGFICVKKHHGNLEPDATFFDISNVENLKRIAEDIENNKEELKHIYGKDISEFFELIKDSKFLRRPLKDFIKKNNKFTNEDWIWLQYLWSLLLTGDKTQLIRGKAYINKACLDESIIKRYQEKIKSELVKRNPLIEKTELFRIRNSIYEEIIESINNLNLDKSRILSINVPTGTGKTLGVYGGAFRLAERIINEKPGQLPSVIYNLPFTSVIDQNYEVLENILDESQIEKYDSFILKHHSLSELK
jgi:CRISPR-associated endonuclease/helicase Cas3